MALTPLPRWASPAMQGLAYWLGYQHANGLAGHLSEGAIATEFQRLMLVHREPGRYLYPEVLYRAIPQFARLPDVANSGARADLVIASATPKSLHERQQFVGKQVEAVIEVKHGRSARAKVRDDIEWLGYCKQAARRDIRTFVLYASVADKPFCVADDGTAVGLERTLVNERTSYKVRRVCRALAGENMKSHRKGGHYVVLIEVLAGGD